MLTEDDIRNIRRRFARWKLAQWDSPTALAGYFGLSRESIYRIVRNDVYAWVSDSDVDTLHGDSGAESCNSDENIEEVTHEQSRNRAVR